jgi:hypothetical protein
MTVVPLRTADAAFAGISAGRRSGSILAVSWWHAAAVQDH